LFPLSDRGKSEEKSIGEHFKAYRWFWRRRRSDAWSLRKGEKKQRKGRYFFMMIHSKIFIFITSSSLHHLRYFSNRCSH